MRKSNDQWIKGEHYIHGDQTMMKEMMKVAYDYELLLTNPKTYQVGMVLSLMAIFILICWACELFLSLFILRIMKACFYIDCIHEKSFILYLLSVTQDIV